MKQQMALLPEKIAHRVVERTAELEKICERERQIAELRLEEYNKLALNYNRLLKRSQSDKCSYETALSQKNCIIANLISAFQKAIDFLEVVCRKALKAVINFAKNLSPDGSHTSKPVPSMAFYKKISADNILPIPWPLFPIPSSRKMNTPKGDGRCRM